MVVFSELEIVFNRTKARQAQMKIQRMRRIHENFSIDQSCNP